MDLWDWLDWLVRIVTVLTLVKMGEPNDALKLGALKPITDQQTAAAADKFVVALMARWDSQRKDGARVEQVADDWPYLILSRARAIVSVSPTRWWWTVPYEMREAAGSALAAGVETDPVNHAALVIQASGWDRTHRLLMDTARSIAELDPVASEQALKLVTRGWFDNRGFTLDALIATATAAVSGT